MFEYKNIRKKGVFVTFCIIAVLMIAGWEKTNAQDVFLAGKKFELKLLYALQRPHYSLTDQMDLFKKNPESSYRNRFGLGLRNYVFEKWFFEYESSISQEGGNYDLEHTDANYWKNSLLIGHNSYHRAKVVFDLFTGVEINSFLKSGKNDNHNNENTDAFYTGAYFSFPVGFGVKTKLLEKTFVGASTFISIGKYKMDNLVSGKISQIVSPAFQLGVTRFFR